MRSVLSGLYLTVCAVQDLQRRKIGVIVSVIAACTAAGLDLLLLFRAPAEILPYLAGLVPGAMLLLLSAVSGGAAGAGDGVCFLILGAFLGARKTWILLMISLVCAALGGGMWMALGRAGRKTKLPFLAFAAAALAVQTAAELAGTIW